MSRVATRIYAHWARIKATPHCRAPRLMGCPFSRGLIVRITTMTPKKPNSAIRHVAKVRLYRKPRITARIPGGEGPMTKFNRVLVRGGRANDLPCVNYSLVRRPYDCPPVHGKRRSRSFYGVRNPLKESLERAGKLRRQRLKAEIELRRARPLPLAAAYARARRARAQA